MPVPDPIAFEIGGLAVRWYGILVATAIAVAVVMMHHRFARHGLEKDAALDIAIIAVPCGIIGARAYYVLFNWVYYAGDIGKILNLRGGGLAIHGGLICGFLAAYFVCRHKGIRFLDALDATVPGIALAQAIGRWGNYFNSEAHGGPTDLPWAITVGGQSVHPTFLYESIWCLVLFFVLTRVDNGRRFVGQTSMLYLMLYSIERFLVEALRTDSLMIGPFKQAQILSLAVIVIAAAGYIILKRKESKDESATHG